MNINLIKILSFFIGLFITLLIISFFKINEHFSVLPDKEPETNNISNIANDVITSINDTVNMISPLKMTNLLSDLTSMVSMNKKEDDDSIIPFSGYKFICINTYKDINKISIANSKWYDIDIDINKHIDYNYNHYFKFNKIINLDKNRLNKKSGALGANITNIELHGPSSSNFANNNETFELHEFTMFMTVKIISCFNKNNIIYEMTGNTTTIDNIIPRYRPSIIFINLIVNENNNYDIHVNIGDKLYKGQIDNIDKSIISDSEYITIGLFYTKKKIGLILNNKIYEYININEYPITLGSTPLIINKYGSLNMLLYNFVYYKTLYDFNYYDDLIRFNNYYISGLNANVCPVIEETKSTILMTEIKPIITNIEKIILPEFKYSILHDKNKDIDINADTVESIMADKEENEENEENGKCILNELKTKVTVFLDKTDEENPNILRRIFGF